MDFTKLPVICRKSVLRIPEMRPEDGRRRIQIMIRSMTGYGRSEKINENCKLVVEIKSVNHRYFDLNLKMPRIFNRFESSIRNILKEYIERGKVDLFITYEDYARSQSALTYHKALAESYVRYCREISEEFGLRDDLSASTVARFPDVITAEDAEIDEEALWRILSEGTREACAALVKAREAEGENLKTDLLKKLSEMRSSVSLIEERSPQIIAEYRNALKQKIADLIGENVLDENRIAAEVTIYADRICVDEEMVRLHSHIDTMEQDLKKGGAVGRKLDFLAQEMNREANTTLSKSSDLAVADSAIFLKTTIEKIREQVQNIE